MFVMWSANFGVDATIGSPGEARATVPIAATSPSTTTSASLTVRVT